MDPKNYSQSNSFKYYDSYYPSIDDVSFDSDDFDEECNSYDTYASTYSNSYDDHKYYVTYNSNYSFNKMKNYYSSSQVKKKKIKVLKAKNNKVSILQEEQKVQLGEKNQEQAESPILMTIKRTMKIIMLITLCLMLIFWTPLIMLKF